MRGREDEREEGRMRGREGGNTLALFLTLTLPGIHLEDKP